MIQPIIKCINLVRLVRSNKKKKILEWINLLNEFTMCDKLRRLLQGLTSLCITKSKLMINKNALPLWFTSIQLHPAMKGLSDKTLISSQFKTVAESNLLVYSIFWCCHNFRKVPGTAQSHWCLGAGESQTCRLALPYVKDRTAQTGIHMDWVKHWQDCVLSFVSLQSSVTGSHDIYL